MLKHVFNAQAGYPICPTRFSVFPVPGCNSFAASFQAAIHLQPRSRPLFIRRLVPDRYSFAALPLLAFHQHIALAPSALSRPDHAQLFQLVHQARRPRVTDAEMPLQQRSTAVL